MPPEMKTTLLSTILIACTSLGMWSQVSEYGIFTESECPIPISEELASRYSEAIKRTKEEFDKQGIHLSAYNYWETASDLAFVMEKLGYEKFFAFGNSAGTIVAQYLLMEHSDHLADWLFSQMYWNTQLPLSMHKIIQKDYSELLGNPGIFLPLQNFSNGSFWTMLLNGWPDPSEEQLLSGSEWEPFVGGMCHHDDEAVPGQSPGGS
jgi:hypothetical protein